MCSCLVTRSEVPRHEEPQSPVDARRFAGNRPGPLEPVDSGVQYLRIGADMKVLVTGACGLVGSAVVRELLGRGFQVTATDLDRKTNRGVVASLQHYASTTAGSLDVRWVDLTSEGAASILISTIAPQGVVHLAAIIPPFCYAHRRLARAVNVDATRSLVEACVQTAKRPRFVLASSIAVYGPRNPHLHAGLLSAATPRRPADLYGVHKTEAEDILTSSDLDWAILRLGGVLSAAQSLGVDRELIAFEASLPGDGRLQSVAVGDVARAFSSALTVERSQAVYLIGGDKSHRLYQRDIGACTAEAMGMPGGIPASPAGDPFRDEQWFATDWMDTTESQQVLDYQRVTFADLMVETRRHTGWRRPLLRAATPLVNVALRLRSPYRGQSGGYADPWGVIEERWGSPSPDIPTHGGAPSPGDS